jgi:hypothetical protein
MLKRESENPAEQAWLHRVDRRAGQAVFVDQRVVVLFANLKVADLQGLGQGAEALDRLVEASRIAWAWRESILSKASRRIASVGCLWPLVTCVSPLGRDRNRPA